MVSFVSLFLGLVMGFQTVAVQVADPVARVTILLDGQAIASLEGPPWEKQIDLGPELVPHELTAVALDSTGTELDRATQWLNLPRQPAETTILIERHPSGVAHLARVSWKSLVDDNPSAIRVEFDGRTLEAEDPRAIPLPPHDPEALHFLRVELEFGGFVRSSAEITFGGTYADQVNTELTAIPVVLDGRKNLPPAAKMEDWFHARGETLRVAAFDKGQTELIVVRDQGAWTRLRRIRAQALSDQAPTVSGRRQGRYDRVQWFRPDRPVWGTWTFQFLWPIPRRLISGEGPYDLFTHSQKYSGESGSLHGWVTTAEQPADWVGTQRLADAVGVAAVTAASGNRRRAVLLILGAEAQDASEAAPEVVHRYLEALGVPLFVWAVDAGATKESPWGTAENVSTPQLMARATRRLFHQLERHRIIWLDGLHLPQQIIVDDSVQGVRRVYDAE